MVFDSVPLQNYTYVDPIVDPVFLFLALVVTALVAAGLTTVWTMRDDSTSLGRAPVDDYNLGDQEPFISPNFRQGQIGGGRIREKEQADSASTRLSGHPAGVHLDGSTNEDESETGSSADSDTQIWSNDEFQSR